MHRVVLSLLLVSCQASTVVLDHYERFVPPATYAAWYAEAEACAGRTGDYAAVQWHVAPGSGWGEGTAYREGQWYPPHTIVLAEEKLGDRWLVVHEMLHDIEQTFDHPAQPFESCRRPAASEP